MLGQSSDAHITKVPKQLRPEDQQAAEIIVLDLILEGAVAPDGFASDNFDITLDYFSISPAEGEMQYVYLSLVLLSLQLYAIPRAPCAAFYTTPMLTGCYLVLVIRVYDQCTGFRFPDLKRVRGDIMVYLYSTMPMLSSATFNSIFPMLEVVEGNLVSMGSEKKERKKVTTT